MKPETVFALVKCTGPYSSSKMSTSTGTGTRTLLHSVPVGTGNGIGTSNGTSTGTSTVCAVQYSKLHKRGDTLSCGIRYSSRYCYIS